MTNNRLVKVFRAVTIVFLCFVICVVWAADANLLPRGITALYHYPNGDKLGHFLLLGLMAFLFNISYAGFSVNLWSIRLPGGSVAAAVLAALEELSQFFFPARTASFFDFAGSLLGIVCLSFISALTIRNWRVK